MLEYNHNIVYVYFIHYVIIVVQKLLHQFSQHGKGLSELPEFMVCFKKYSFESDGTKFTSWPVIVILQIALDADNVWWTIINANYNFVVLVLLTCEKSAVFSVLAYRHLELDETKS